jgi:glycosyltransferase involved in cell wall biosynthesis
MKHVVMLGTAFETRGGISSVVNVYREHGLFQRFPVIYLATHVDGAAPKKLRYCIRAWLRLMGLLAMGKVTLVHVHIATGASFWRKLLFVYPAFALRVPAILHLHSGDFDEYAEAPLRRWLVRDMFERAACIVVLSDTWQQWAATVCHNPNIVPIYNPVRLPPAVDARQRDACCILFLGQMIEFKGVYDLLRAAAHLRHRHPRMKLVMAGDGQVQQVRSEAERLGLQDHVEVLEWVSGAAKLALLERAAIYALPSYCEGLPMSVLEAMAAGLPVVCTPVGGLPEAVTDGIEGRVVAPGDIAALVAALDDLLSSPERCRRMGEAARRKIEARFSDTRVLPQVENLYLQLGAQPCLRLPGP